jgi:fluoroquinolone resistance protein
MKNKSVTDQLIENMDFSGRSVEKVEYESCTFKNCNFSDSHLNGSRFIDTEFVNCNLSNAGIAQVTFQDVTFNNCKMLGLHFDQSNPFGFSVSFITCQLNDSIFYEVKLGRSSFLDSQLRAVDFTSAELKNSPVRNCDLLNAIFDNTDLEKADLSGSVNYSINPQLNKIKGAKFSWPDVKGLLDVYKIVIE